MKYVWLVQEVVGGAVPQWESHLWHASQNNSPKQVSKRITLGQGNVGWAYPAIVKMNDVFARSFGDLSNLHSAWDQPLAPQFVEHLLSLCFYWESVWHKISLYERELKTIG